MKSDEFCALDQRLTAYNDKMAAIGAAHPVCQRLLTSPGGGPLTVTALVAAVSEATHLKNGWQFAAWVGLVPRQHSTGGKARLLGSSNRGDSYIRKLLVHGARATLRWGKCNTDRRSQWLRGRIERRGKNKAAGALALTFKGVCCSCTIFLVAWSCIPSSVNPRGVTDQQVMGLHALEVQHQSGVQHHLDQHHRAEEGEDHRCGGCGGQALVARQVLLLVVQGQPDLPLDQRIDEHPHHRQHGSGGNPLGFLPPHWRDSGRVLAPATPRLSRTLLVVIGLENLRLGTPRTPDWGRQDRPSLVGFSLLSLLSLYDHARALFQLRRFRCGRASSVRPLFPWRARLDTLGEGRRAPGPRPAATAAWGAAGIDGNHGFGISGTRILLHGYMLDRRGDPLGFLGVRRRRGRGLLLRQRAGMDHDTSASLLHGVAVRVLDLHTAPDPLAPPASGSLW
jgi:Transposase IS116/IS110/IS902 family